MAVRLWAGDILHVWDDLGPCEETPEPRGPDHSELKSQEDNRAKTGIGLSLALMKVSLLAIGSDSGLIY